MTDNLVMVTFSVKNDGIAQEIISEFKQSILKRTSVYRIGPIYKPVASINDIMWQGSGLNRGIDKTITRSGWNNGRE